MKRICSKCGKVFQGGTDSILCPTCKEIEAKNFIRERVCIDCVHVFDGGPRARRCPDCRIIARREALARHRKSGTLRAIGSIDTCSKCGKKYVVKSARQKYCSDACSRVSVLEWQRDHKKATRNPEKANAAHTLSSSKRQKVCKYCLEPFWSNKSSDLCSEYCRKNQERINQCESDIRRGRKRNLNKYLDERERYRATRRKENSDDV